MPLIALVIVAVAAGALTTAIAWRLPGRSVVAEAAHAGLRARRLDPNAATGLALTLALVVILAGAVALGVLTLITRASPEGTGIDASAASWGDRHATAFTHDVLSAITDVGQPRSIIVLAVVFGVVETVRTRSRWIAPFLAVVVAGNGALTTTVKHLEDRVRPAFDPMAASLGPSFPSGHSSWSAAFFAAAALVLARGRPRAQRCVLAGVAVGLAVAIAATRVLLTVHWFTDVLAGLAVGWAWFSACAIAFGGRLLRFGATAEAAGVKR
jgi:membrane-associated phospholipid phosphatase